MPNQTQTFLITSLLLLSSFSLIPTTNTSSINSYKDLLSRTRKNTYISFDSIQKMLERVISESDVSISIDWKQLYSKSDRPERIIEEYLTVQSNRSKINNAMKLLCFNMKEEENDLSGFDFEVFVEQSFSMSDKDVIKSTFYAFREVYSFFSMGKSVEMVFSTDILSDLSFVCDEGFDLTNPSSFFVKNENKLKNLHVKPVFNKENRLVAHVFYLKVNSQVNVTISNQIYRNFLEENEFFLGKGEFFFEISFYNEGFNGIDDHLLSSKRYIISTSIYKDLSHEENYLKLVYLNLVLEYRILERLVNVSDMIFNYSHSVLFKVYFNPSYAFRYIINKDNEGNDKEKEQYIYLPYNHNNHNNNNEIDKNTNKLLSIELGLILDNSIDSLQSTEKSLFTQMQTFSKSISEKNPKSNQIIQEIKSKSSDLYFLKSELWKCDDKVFTFYKQFKSDGSEHEFDDNEFIVKSIMSLCYLKKGINFMKNEILLENQVLAKEYNTFLIENQDFQESLLFSIRLIQPESFVISSYVYKVRNLLICQNDFTCINTKMKTTSKTEASIVLLSNIKHISKYFNSLYDVFDVYTTNYMEHLNYAKYVLYKSFFETYFYFKSLFSLLDSTCKVNEFAVLADFYEVVFTVSQLKVEVEEKVSFFRNLFYSFYYNKAVPSYYDEGLVKSVGMRIIYSDFFRNSQFLQYFYGVFEDVLKCVHEKNEEERKNEKDKKDEKNDL